MCNCLTVQLWCIVGGFLLAQKLVQNDKKRNGSFSITKTPQLVILNAVKNPAYSMDESCMKADKRFTAHNFTQTLEILPRPKARSE